MIERGSIAISTDLLSDGQIMVGLKIYDDPGARGDPRAHATISTDLARRVAASLVVAADRIDKDGARSAWMILKLSEAAKA